MEPKVNPVPVVAVPEKKPAITKVLRPRCATCMYPVYPSSIWGFDAPEGKRFECKKCGNHYAAGQLNGGDGRYRDLRLYHLIFRRGMGDRSVLSWQYVPGLKKVYITCVCGPLLPVELVDINKDGFVGYGLGGGCVQCDWCHLHFWPFLEDWPKLHAELKAAEKIKNLPKRGPDGRWMKSTGEDNAKK